MIQWPGLTVAIVLILILLLSAMFIILAQKLLLRVFPKFIWVEYGGFKWKTWRQKQDTEWMPFCIECQVELVKPEYRNSVFCPVCNKKWNYPYETHRAHFDAARNKAEATLQKHSRFDKENQNRDANSEQLLS